MFRPLFIALVLSVLAVTAVACGSAGEPTSAPFPTSPVQPTGEGTPPISPEVPFAQVNGEVLPIGELEMRFAQATDSYAANGADVNDPGFQAQLRQALIERIIDETLLLQAASKQGIKADAAEVDRYFNEAASQFATEEEFNARLTELHLDAAQLRENIEEDLTMNAYVSFHLENNVAPEDLEPTEAELREIYDAQVAQLSGQIPSFEEARPTIEPQVRQQKRSEQVAKLLDSLEAESEIEILVQPPA